MSLFQHLALALAYLAAAVAVALTLPHSVPTVDRPTAALAGALVLLFGAVLHEVYARQQRDRLLAWHLKRLRDDQAALAARLDRLHDLVQAPPQPEPPAVSADPGPAAGEVLVQPPRDADAPPAPDEATVHALLEEAVRRDTFELMVQPIVRLPQRRHRFYQAELRLMDAEGRDLDPARWYPVAQREGLLVALDKARLFRCVQLLREMERRQHAAGLFCAVTADTLAQAAFMSDLTEYLTGNPGLAARLVLELGQADLARPGVLGAPALLELGRLGVRLSMDQVRLLDLDTRRLALHGVRFVKLEALLLERCAAPGGMARLGELKSHLKAEGIDLIVTGIAAEKQLVDLLELDIDFGQGDLFGAPRPSRLAL